MRSEGLVGPQALSDEEYGDLRLSPSGALVITSLHGKYYEQNYRGNLFFVTNASGPAQLKTDGSTAFNAFALYNPPGSGKNLVIVRTFLSLTLVPTSNQVAGAFEYVYATNVTISGGGSTAGAGLLPCYIGTGTQPVAQAFGGGTVSAAPKTLYPLASKTDSVNPAAYNGRIIDEPEGCIILAPGTYLSIYETVGDSGGTFSGHISMIWEEIPA